MDALVQPLLERFTAIGLAIPQATSIEQQEQCTSSMTHIVQMTTAVSKGFIKPSHLVESMQYYLRAGTGQLYAGAFE